MKFAVYFGNRGFFPGELIESAIADYRQVLAANGHEALIMEGAGTRYDAVETPEEGAKFAAFLKDVRAIRGAFIMCAPKFGAGSVGETALSSALRLDKVLREFEDKLK